MMGACVCVCACDLPAPGQVHVLFDEHRPREQDVPAGGQTVGAEHRGNTLQVKLQANALHVAPQRPPMKSHSSPLSTSWHFVFEYMVKV